MHYIPREPGGWTATGVIPDEQLGMMRKHIVAMGLTITTLEAKLKIMGQNRTEADARAAVAHLTAIAAKQGVCTIDRHNFPKIDLFLPEPRNPFLDSLSGRSAISF